MPRNRRWLALPLLYVPALVFAAVFFYVPPLVDMCGRHYMYRGDSTDGYMPLPAELKTDIENVFMNQQGVKWVSPTREVTDQGVYFVLGDKIRYQNQKKK